MVIGAIFGASASADAFFVAFRIPNLFRRVVAEGAASTAFVPVLTSYREREGPRAALRAAGALGVVSAALLAAVSILGSLFAGPVVGLFAPGFTADPAKHLLTVSLTAAVFPYLGLVGMAAWAMGTLHTFRRFAPPAYGPVLFNVAMVTAALALSGRFAMPVYSLAVGVIAGGALQFMVQLPALRALGFDRECLALGHPAVARVGRLLIPTVVGGAVYQINVLVGTVLGSMLPARSISYLWYADRLFEFPLGIIAVAVGTAVLPTMASHASGARYGAMASGTEHALQLVWALCIPATVGLWILAPCLVETLFQRGEFGRTDTLMTADALRAFVVGLVGVASARVLVSVFYALERPRVPVITGMFALVVNAVCDFVSMGPVPPATSLASRLISELSTRWSFAALGHVGLALGTSIAATINAVLLFAFARRLLPGFAKGRLIALRGEALLRVCDHGRRSQRLSRLDRYARPGVRKVRRTRWGPDDRGGDLRDPLSRASQRGDARSNRFRASHRVSPSHDVRTFARRHAASSSSRDAFMTLHPRPRSSCSISRNRRSNRSNASCIALSALTPSRRERLTAVKSTSPNSDAISFGFPAAQAASSSRTSSSNLCLTPVASSQSNPTAAAFWPKR